MPGELAARSLSLCAHIRLHCITEVLEHDKTGLRFKFGTFYRSLLFLRAQAGRPSVSAGKLRSGEVAWGAH